jgi:hypothetical protein
LKAYYLKDVDFMEESIETINQTACEERKLQKGEKNVYMD